MDELGHRLIEAVRRSGAKRVVVDGIGAFERAMLFPKRLPALINAVNSALKSLGATILYTKEVQELHELDRLSNDDMSAMAENLVLMHYQRNDRLLRRMLSVLKVRDSDFDPITEEFYITGAGIQFGTRPAPLIRPVDAKDIPEAAPGEAPPAQP